MKSALILLLMGLFCFLSSAHGGCLECSGVTNSGPTMLMEYRADGQGNTVDTFMYFVPLIAPTAIDVYTDPNTTLNARIISRSSEVTGSTFKTTCVFEVSGNGCYEAYFDPAEMIAFNLKGDDSPRTLNHLLRSIRVDGTMAGHMEVTGTIKNGMREVERLETRFDLGGKSPVTVHLYDVDYDGKDCRFEDRFNEELARINSLSFVRGGNPPRMSIEVCAIAGEEENEGIFAAFKAILANWFIPPLSIATIGNDTMIKFAAALDATETTFTFPYAQNLRQSLSILLAKQEFSSQVSQQVQ